MQDDYLQGVFTNQYFSFKNSDITWDPLTCQGKTTNQIFFEIAKAFKEQDRKPPLGYNIERLPDKKYLINLLRFLCSDHEFFEIDKMYQ